MASFIVAEGHSGERDLQTARDAPAPLAAGSA